MRLSIYLLLLMLVVAVGGQRTLAQAQPQSPADSASKPQSDNKPSTTPEQNKSGAPSDQQSGPTIDKIKPESGYVGDLVTITGKNFGPQPGSVVIGGKDAKTDADHWTDTLITTVVPVGATSGEVVVTTADSKKSPSKTLTVKVEYDQSAFELLTGVGAEVAGAEVTSYTVDTTNNALSQTNVGRKRVEILLGGGFILPWHKGGGWIERSYCGAPDTKAAKKLDESKHPTKPADPNEPLCRPHGDVAYKNYRPWETFLSIRFAPGSDQTINGFVVGGGYRITKYFSLLVGYAATPFNEPTHGFRETASQIVAANPTIYPYNNFNASDLLNNRPGAFDGFPLFLYNASGVTTTKIFPTSPVVVHFRSSIYFGVGIPLNLTALFKPGAGK